MSSLDDAIGIVLYQYRIYCVTESLYVYMWQDSTLPTPTVCPNNNTHTINSAVTTVVNQVASNATYALEPTSGYFRVEDIVVPVAAGSAGDITTFNQSWPYQINMWDAGLMITDDLVGDQLTVVVSPNTVVGALTATANIGDTVLNVNSTAAQTIWPGFYIALNGTNIGRCSAVNATGLTITMPTALTASYAPGAYVMINLHLIDNIYIESAVISSGFAKKGFKGKLVPPGTVLQLQYTNNSTSAKTVVFRVEYYYAF